MTENCSCNRKSPPFRRANTNNTTAHNAETVESTIYVFIQWLYFWLNDNSSNNNNSSSYNQHSASQQSTFSEIHKCNNKADPATGLAGGRRLTGQPAGWQDRSAQADSPSFKARDATNAILNHRRHLYLGSWFCGIYTV